ncbi:MAG: S-layer homology domain-containing protein [Eubacteriales bacterium]
MLKKIFAKYLALIMMVQLVLPVQATDFSSWSELTDGGTFTGSKYYLNQDVNLNSSVEFKNVSSYFPSTAQLDLNSYTLQRYTNDTMIQIATSGMLTLTIQDSSGAGTGTITGGSGTGTESGGVQISSKNSVILEGGTITGNSSSSEGGGVKGEESSSFDMNNGVISQNTAVSGGGVTMYRSTFTMKKGRISSNVATQDGGGVYLNLSTFNMSSGEISSNEATEDGGGVYLKGSNFTMSDDALISHNTSSIYSGGVFVDSSSRFIMTGGVITNNKVENTTANTGDGGGVLVYRGDFELSDGEISNNIVTGDGGGVLVYNSTMEMSGGAITGNTAGRYGGGVYLDRSTLNLSGEVYIQDNQLSDGTVNNVQFASDSKLNITGTLHENSRIGVTNAGGTVGDFTSSGATDYATVDNFFSDDPLYSVYVNGTAFALGYAPATFGGGDGTASNPYLIYTVEHLEELAFYTNLKEITVNGDKVSYGAMHYKLMNNLDLGSIPDWTAIGNSPYTASGPFKGTFDGNGYTIDNLTVTRSYYTGLFGYIDTAGIVKNLSLTNVSVPAGTTAGGIAENNYGTIHSCSVSGNITGTTHSGGIAGYSNGSIYNSYNTATIISNGTGYAPSAGGIAGTIGPSAKIENCYNIGVVSTSTSAKVGGIVGIMSSTSTIANNFWSNASATNAIGDNSSGSPSDTGAKVISTAEDLLSALSDWVTASVGMDFSNWKIIPIQNSGYPVFQAILILLTPDDFDFSPPSSLEYDGNPKEVTFATAVTPVPSYTLYYTGTGSTSYATSNLPPSEEGTYSVTIEVTENDTYGAVHLSDPSWIFTIFTTTEIFENKLDNLDSKNPASYDEIRAVEDWYQGLSQIEKDKIHGEDPSLSDRLDAYTGTLPATLSVTLSSGADNFYTVQDSFDPNDYEVTVTQRDGTEILLSTGDWWADLGSGADSITGLLLAGTHRITIYYDEVETESQIIVLDIYDITGKITNSDGSALADVDVTLYQKNEDKGNTSTNFDGNFTLYDVPEGIYNLEAKTSGTDVIIQTILVNLTKNTIETVVMPEVGRDSHVTLPVGSEVLAVGGVELVANSIVLAAGETVAVTLEISETVDTKEQEEIKAEIESNEEMVLWMDISLNSVISTGTEDKTDVIENTNTLLEVVIELPEDLQNKGGYAVYRQHGDEIHKIYTTKNNDGEYIEVEGIYLTIHTKKFSTYGVAVADRTITAPSTENNGSNNGSTASPSPSVPEENSSNHSSSSNSSSSSSSSNSSSSSTSTPVLEVSTGGTVTISPERATSGKTVTITLSPEEGYTLDSMIVLDGNNNLVQVTLNEDGTYSFIQPISKVTVEVVFLPIVTENIPTGYFGDVRLSSWYYDVVYEICYLGLMTGTGYGEFSPESSITRGMLAQILYNLAEGEPVSQLSSFSDVPSHMYYAMPIAWAEANNVVAGYHDGTYRPEKAINREELAVILYAFHKNIQDAPVTENKPLSFTDSNDVTDWAYDPLCWAVEEGLIAGLFDNKLDPQGEALRGQVAQILLNYIEITSPSP